MSELMQVLFSTAMVLLGIFILPGVVLILLVTLGAIKGIGEKKNENSTDSK